MRLLLFYCTSQKKKENLDQVRLDWTWRPGSGRYVIPRCSKSSWFQTARGRCGEATQNSGVNGETLMSRILSACRGDPEGSHAFIHKTRSCISLRRIHDESSNHTLLLLVVGLTLFTFWNLKPTSKQVTLEHRKRRNLCTFSNRCVELPWLWTINFYKTRINRFLLCKSLKSNHTRCNHWPSSKNTINEGTLHSTMTNIHSETQEIFNTQASIFTFSIHHQPGWFRVQDATSQSTMVTQTNWQKPCSRQLKKM